MSYRLLDIQRQRMATLKLGVEVVGHCKYSELYDVPFSSYLMLNNRELENVMKVIQTGTIRMLGCGFLFAFHSNYSSIFNV